MPHYLYVFGFNTPEQIQANEEHGWDDEDSEAIFISAESEPAALAWGQQVAKKYVANLYGDRVPTWEPDNYANGIESNPEVIFSPDSLRHIQIIQVGEHPVFEGAHLNLPNGAPSKNAA